MFHTYTSMNQVRNILVCQCWREMHPTWKNARTDGAWRAISRYSFAAKAPLMLLIQTPRDKLPGYITQSILERFLIRTIHQADDRCLYSTAFCCLMTWLYHTNQLPEE